MADGVIYLDIDDEITSAAARIRTTSGRRATLVLPYGSRVATSRINFRLLARDALEHDKRLSIVSGDAATRALAASAGLPAFASVGEYESSLAVEGAIADHPVELSATIAVPEAPVAALTPPAGSDASGDDAARWDDAAPPTTATAVTAATTSEHRPSDEDARASASVATAGSTSAADQEGSRERVSRSGGRAGARPRDGARPGDGGGRGGSRPPRVGRGVVAAGAAVLALTVLVGGVGAYLVLPTATVTVTPRLESIGPVSLRVSASTAIDAPDVAAGLVPAVDVAVDVRADGTFPATGTRIEEAAATGQVRFVNLDPTSSNGIAKGAVVRSSSGVEFRTDAAITIPAAELVFDPAAGKFTVEPATATVGVTAVEAGPDGNLAANTITTTPRGEEPLFLKVSNPAPTTGGSRTEFPRVTQDDVDAALASLTADLDAAFAERLADPSLVGEDVTVFPETASLGAPVPTVDPATLVGAETETFDLGLVADGTVTTVDAAPVRAIAEARLAAAVDAGHVLVAGSSEVTESPAVIEGGTITYPVVATARQVAVLDPVTLEASILGLPVEEAGRALAAYGEVGIEVWPDWVAAIPNLDSRVEVAVLGPEDGS